MKMTWAHAFLQAWLIFKHPFKLAFQDHYYTCKRCGLSSGSAHDLCDPKLMEWEGSKE